MRAIRVSKFGEPSVLKLCMDITLPTIKKDELLVKIQAVGVNPVDTYIRAGRYSRLPSLPYTPGHDLSGVVCGLGDDIKHFNIGDRVFTSAKGTSGSYAEYASVSSDFTFHLPDNISFHQGAAVGVSYFTAYRALFLRGQAKIGDTILIHGASGGTGLAACQLGKQFGLKVLGTAGSLEGERIVKNHGYADLVFSHKSSDYLEALRKACPSGIDVILEMLANVNLNTDLKLLAPGGNVVIIGSRGTVEIDPRLTMATETDIKGVALLNSSVEQFKQMGNYIVEGLKGGSLIPKIGNSYTLENAHEAHIEVIEHKKGSNGKIILDLTE